MKEAPPISMRRFRHGVSESKQRAGGGGGAAHRGPAYQRGVDSMISRAGFE